MSTPQTPAPATPKENLYTDPQALDRVAHRGLRLSRLINTDYSPARGMNALYANAVEFIDLAREYPVVFVRAGEAKEGAAMEVAPMAVLGLKRGENLYLQPDGSWRADYVPATLRAYPFVLVRTDDANYVICFDKAWGGFSEQDGEPLFDAAGEATEFLKGVQNYLEQLDNEMNRTRAFCQRLVELGLLQDMRFDAQVPNGEPLVVDGFLAIDEKKLAELPEATVVELHRSGMLTLINAQLSSLGLMRRLVERRLALNASA